MPGTLLPTAPYCTIGPFFPGEFVSGCEDLTSFQGNPARGQHILFSGRVFEDGNRPILNAIVEIWQPDANGVFRHPKDPRFEQADPGFFGWGRARTDADGQYWFRTVLPGAPPGRRRHINLMILAIGLTRRLVTTVFFDDGSSSPDPIFDSVTDPAAQARMLARSESDSGNRDKNIPVYRYHIVTRGQLETPFFLD
jgi:protocatechuate 3,4-dioxygenase beta subunit